MPIQANNSHDQLVLDLRPILTPKLSQVAFTQAPFYPMFHEALINGAQYLERCFYDHTEVTAYQIRKITKPLYDTIIQYLNPYDIVVLKSDIPKYQKLVKQLANQMRTQLRELIMPSEPTEHQIGLHLMYTMETKCIFDILVEHPDSDPGDQTWTKNSIKTLNQFWTDVKPLMTNSRKD